MPSSAALLTVLHAKVALKSNGGNPVTADGLEWRFAQQGFMQTELEEDPFKVRVRGRFRRLLSRGRSLLGGYQLCIPQRRQQFQCSSQRSHSGSMCVCRVTQEA